LRMLAAAYPRSCGSQPKWRPGLIARALDVSNEL
jgi:hypothetical protein